MPPSGSCWPPLSAALAASLAASERSPMRDFASLRFVGEGLIRSATRSYFGLQPFGLHVGIHHREPALASVRPSDASMLGALAFGNQRHGFGFLCGLPGLGFVDLKFDPTRQSGLRNVLLVAALPAISRWCWRGKGRFAGPIAAGWRHAVPFFTRARLRRWHRPGIAVEREGLGAGFVGESSALWRHRRPWRSGPRAVDIPRQPPARHRAGYRPACLVRRRPGTSPSLPRRAHWPNPCRCRLFRFLSFSFSAALILLISSCLASVIFWPAPPAAASA